MTREFNEVPYNFAKKNIFIRDAYATEYCFNIMPIVLRISVHIIFTDTVEVFFENQIEK